VALLFAQEADSLGFWWTLAGLVSLPVLIGLNAFFVAAEFSLVVVRKTRIEEMVSQGVKGASFVRSAIEHLDRSIAATQLGITLSSIALGFFAEQALASVLIEAFRHLSAPWHLIATHSVSASIAFAIITFFHVVVGELIPKSLALTAPTRIAIWVSAPLLVFAWVTRPVIILMNGTGNTILKWIGARPAMETLVHSVEELALLIEDVEEAGGLDPAQAELVQNVFQLSNKKVADCMVPRDKMAALELTMPSDKVLEAVRSGAHTRMPVYSAEFDNIVGIVNTKNLFYLFSLHGVVVLEDAIYPALFLKPDEEVANALRLFKKAKRPMALVRDDNGKIHGLVTLEDILEEIIGAIEDEHDQPVPRVPRSRLRSLRQATAEKKK
jgi:CBS domain containing-hemolysin-like protein